MGHHSIISGLVIRYGGGDETRGRAAGTAYPLCSRERRTHILLTLRMSKNGRRRRRFVVVVMVVGSRVVVLGVVVLGVVVLKSLWVVVVKCRGRWVVIVESRRVCVVVGARRTFMT